MEEIAITFWLKYAEPAARHGSNAQMLVFSVASPLLILRGVKTTPYFDLVRNRPDRASILDEWISRAVRVPAVEQVQADGRIRRWVTIPERGHRWLRVVVLADGETVHNAFFDRGFAP